MATLHLVSGGGNRLAESGKHMWELQLTAEIGNAQGNVILFEPSTSEHLSSRTIFDPVTALAPAADCRTFAIGYVVRLHLGLRFSCSFIHLANR